MKTSAPPASEPTAPAPTIFDEPEEVSAFPPPRRHPLGGVCVMFLLGTWLGLSVPGFASWMVWPLVAGFAIWGVFNWAATRATSPKPCAAAGEDGSSAAEADGGGAPLSEAALVRERRLATALVAASRIAFLALFFWAGFVRATVVADRSRETLEIFRNLADSGEPLVLRGEVTTDPSISILPHGGARARFILRATAIPDEHGELRISPTPIRVDLYGPVSMKSERPPFRLPRAGEGWQYGGRLVEVETKSATPFLVLRQAGRDRSTKPAPELDASPFYWALHRLRGYAAEALGRGVEKHFPQSVSLVRAMTLGYRSDIPRDVEEAFKASGTIHVFAISGLHVGIIAGLIVSLFVLLDLPLRWRPIALFPILVAYVILTGGRPSAVRSCVMTLLVFGSILAERPSDAINSLCFAALLIVGYDPMQLLDLGFLFSFACTYGILAFVYPINDAVSVVGRWFRGVRRRRLARELVGAGAEPDEWALALGSVSVLQERESSSRWTDRLVKLRGMLAVSVATWLLSAPLTAYCFGRLSPIAILCNLPVIPLAVGVVTCAASSLLCALIFPPLCAVFNLVNVVLTEAMTQTAQLASRIPGAVAEVEPWSFSAVLLWYGVLFTVYIVYRAVRSV